MSRDKNATWIKDVVMLDTQGSKAPENIKDLVRDFAVSYDMHNGTLVAWDSDEDGQDYPELDTYLRSNDITKCVVYFWW
jgi:hypothetical protein